MSSNQPQNPTDLGLLDWVSKYLYGLLGYDMPQTQTPGGVKAYRYYSTLVTWFITFTAFTLGERIFE